MTPKVAKRPRARLDLLEQFVYLGDQTGVEFAERYFAAVRETCRALAKNPQIGPLYDSGISRLAGMRRFPVKGFEKYLVFYQPRTGGIDVVRVLHGARDVANVFATEEA